MAATINRDELREAVNEGEVVLLEALPASYFEEQHLPGALNLPLDDLDELAARLVPDKDQPVVTYCSNDACSNSAIAADRLEELGYRNVRRYEAGKQDWVEAGLPTESGAGRVAD